MPIRKLLVPVMGLPADQAALDLAFRAGRHLDAHVAALYGSYDALGAVAFMDPTASGTLIADAGVKPETSLRLRDARVGYDAAKAKWAVPPRNRPAEGIGFSTSFVIANGRVDDMVAEYGRVADLVVLSLPTAQEETLRATLVHAAIMETGKPVLLTPNKPVEDPFRRIAVAWNGSASAAQTLGHAMSLLGRAEEVTVLDAANPIFAGPPASQAAEYIGWHGVAARVVTVAAGTGRPAGLALLEAAGAAGAGMLVMGAYSQSRVRRMIAGGVTRAVMERTGLPVFMAH
jgi:nucleotide-binding universal stress UspA family protein